MKRFSELWERLEREQGKDQKASLISYLRNEAKEDAICSLYLLLGRKVKRFCSPSELKSWGAEISGLPLWLVEESCEATGDSAEAVAMLLPDGEGSPLSLYEVLNHLRVIEKGLKQKEFVLSLWPKLTRTERYIFNKVMGGGIKPAIEHRALLTATAESFGLSTLSVGIAFAQAWDPLTDNIDDLFRRCNLNDNEIPFCLASPLEEPLASLGDPKEWQIEWHWNGKRAQLIKGELEGVVWSRHGEVITSLPELVQVVPTDTVLDGMLMQREEKGATLFIVVDILRYEGEDLRDKPLTVRREKLERCRISSSHIDISPRLSVRTWEEVELLRREARSRRAEGVILKRLDSPYHPGRLPGAWWKVRGDPLTANVILMYAQRGERRAPSTYTFGVWRGEELVPVAKTAVGLTPEERREVGELIKLYSRERFGPVRTIEPLFVFEIGFRDVAVSKRHKAGIILISPQILTRKRDITASQATRWEELAQLVDL